jgi:hypothetical protein
MYASTSDAEEYACQNGNLRYVGLRTQVFSL